MNADGEPEAALLLDRAAGGDVEAWGALLARHHERLTCVVSFRLDPRLRGRIDVADVMQEAFIAATERRADFFGQSAQPLFLWLRWMVANTLLEVHRHHLSAQKRDVRREVRPTDCSDASDNGDGTRAALVAQLTGGITGPATAAGEAELKARLNEALGKLDGSDRELLALRHYEQLSNREAAQVLNIQEGAAAKRYLRALERLRELLSEISGGLSELRP